MGGLEGRVQVPEDGATLVFDRAERQAA